MPFSLPDIISDSDIEQLFARLRPHAAAAVQDAVIAAASAATAQLPALGAAARRELEAAIVVVRARLGETVDQEIAHAIRVLAQHQPELRAQLDEAARSAGVAASEGALDEVDRRGGLLSASARPWVVAGGVVAALLVVALAAHAATVAAEPKNGRVG